MVLFSGFTSLDETKNSLSIPLKASCKDSGILKSAQQNPTPLSSVRAAVARFEDDAANEEAGTCWRRVSRTLRPKPPVTPVTKILGAIAFRSVDECLQRMLGSSGYLCTYLGTNPRFIYTNFRKNLYPVSNENMSRHFMIVMIKRMKFIAFAQIKCIC